MQHTRYTNLSSRCGQYHPSKLSGKTEKKGTTVLSHHLGSPIPSTSRRSLIFWQRVATRHTQPWILTYVQTPPLKNHHNSICSSPAVLKTASFAKGHKVNWLSRLHFTHHKWCDFLANSRNTKSGFSWSQMIHYLFRNFLTLVNKSNCEENQPSYLRVNIVSVSFTLVKTHSDSLTPRASK